jgi:hypothetical protein
MSSKGQFLKIVLLLLSKIPMSLGVVVYTVSLALRRLRQEDG